MDRDISEEVGKLVSKVIADYDGTNLFNKPDRNEIINIVNNMFFVAFPGYFKDRSYKMYNLENGIAVMVEDIFYHLNKQVSHELYLLNVPVIPRLMTEYAHSRTGIIISDTFIIGENVKMTRGGETVKEEIKQSDEWFYII